MAAAFLADGASLPWPLPARRAQARGTRTRRAGGHGVSLRRSQRVSEEDQSTLEAGLYVTYTLGRTRAARWLRAVVALAAALTVTARRGGRTVV